MTEPVGDELVERLRLKDGRVPGYSELVKYCSEAAAALQAKDRQIAELTARQAALWEGVLYAADALEAAGCHNEAMHTRKALGGQHDQAK
jgi:hypothetical protein